MVYKVPDPKLVKLGQSISDYLDKTYPRWYLGEKQNVVRFVLETITNREFWKEFANVNLKGYLNGKSNQT